MPFKVSQKVAPCRENHNPLFLKISERPHRSVVNEEI